MAAGCPTPTTPAPVGIGQPVKRGTRSCTRSLPVTVLLEPDTVRSARCYPSRLLPWPNRLGKARKEAYRQRKFFVAPSPYPNSFSWRSALPCASISASEITR